MCACMCVYPHIFSSLRRCCLLVLALPPPLRCLFALPLHPPPPPPLSISHPLPSFFFRRLLLFPTSNSFYAADVIYIQVMRPWPCARPVCLVLCLCLLLARVFSLVSCFRPLFFFCFIRCLFFSCLCCCIPLCRR